LKRLSFGLSKTRTKSCFSRSIDQQQQQQIQCGPPSSLWQAGRQASKQAAAAAIAAQKYIHCKLDFGFVVVAKLKFCSPRKAQKEEQRNFSVYWQKINIDGIRQAVMTNR